MFWCLKAPNHYLKHCLLIINWILWNAPKINSTMPEISVLDISFKIMPLYNLYILIQGPRANVTMSGHRNGVLCGVLFWFSYTLLKSHLLVPGRHGCHFESIIFNLIIQNGTLGTRCEIDECHKPHLWEVSIGSANGLVPSAIIWTNANSLLFRHMA